MHKPTGGGNPLRMVMALFGFHDGGRTLVDVVVDSLRNVLYTLDKIGNIDLFDLGVDGNKTIQKVTCRLFCCYRSVLLFFNVLSNFVWNYLCLILRLVGLA